MALQRRAALVALLLLLPACGTDTPQAPAPGAPGTQESTGPRPWPIPPSGTLPKGHPPLDSAHGTVPVPPPPPPSAAPNFAFTLPEGWESRPGGGFRMHDFRVPAHPGVECYTTLLAGDGGGLASNVNRWRDQAGLGRLSEEDVANLPKIEILGAPATLVEAVGSFQGMDGVRKEGHMVLGAIRLMDDAALFIKMTGPTEAVQGEKDRFVEFCRSLK